MRYRKKNVFCLGMVLLLFFQTFSFQAFSFPRLLEPTKKADVPDLFQAVRFSGYLEFCGERVPLEKREVRETLEKALLLALWDRAQVVLWLKRCGRIMPVVERHLKRRALPVDLKYVPVIESALRPHAGSHQGAVGYWQFIPATGRQYGLRIDRFIDQRRNLEFSTQAGLAYLQDLYQRFGSWTLALAAYNMGEKGLEQRMKQQKISSYYDLQLPAETMFYVYKAIAAKLLLSHPERYGFYPAPGDIYRPIEQHHVAVQVRRITPLQLLVDAAGISLKSFREHNPDVLGNTLPAGWHILSFPVILPQNFREKIEKALKSYKPSKPKRKVRKGRWHTVRSGESLYRIARRYRISVKSLMKWNGLGKKSLLRPGMRLRLQP